MELTRRKLIAGIGVAGAGGIGVKAIGDRREREARERHVVGENLSHVPFVMEAVYNSHSEELKLEVLESEESEHVEVTSITVRFIAEQGNARAQHDNFGVEVGEPHEYTGVSEDLYAVRGRAHTTEDSIMDDFPLFVMHPHAKEPFVGKRGEDYTGNEEEIRRGSR